MPDRKFERRNTRMFLSGRAGSKHRHKTNGTRKRRERDRCRGLPGRNSVRGGSAPLERALSTGLPLRRWASGQTNLGRIGRGTAGNRETAYILAVDGSAA